MYLFVAAYSSVTKVDYDYILIAAILRIAVLFPIEYREKLEFSIWYTYSVSCGFISE